MSIPESQPRSVYAAAIPVDSTRWTGKTFSQTSFDPIGRPLSTVTPNGETTLHTYTGDAHSVILDSRDSGIADKIIRWEKTDLYGRLSEVRTYNYISSAWVLDANIVLTHDARDNLTQVNRTVGGATTTLSSMTYDKAGRKLSMNDADLGNWTYAYDRENNLTRQTDARGWTTCLYYDNVMARLVGKYLQANNTTCPAAPTYTISYGYDAGHVVGSNASRGQLTSVGYSDDRWDKTITYNSSGQLAKESVTIIGTSLLSTTYQYDSYLRPWKTTYPDGEVLTTGYNSMGVPMTLTSGSSVVLVDSAVYSVTGQLLSMRMPAGGNLWRTQSYFPWVNGTSSDSNGRLSAIKIGTSNGASNKLSLSYSYDSFSNIDRIVERYDSGTTYTNTFTYDAQNRLLTGYAKDYNYDASGRIVKYEATANNQTFNTTFPLHAIKNSGYAYDANGNMITRGTQTLVWGAANYLVQVKNGSTVLESYTYDADGNRVKKTVGSTNFYYPFPTYEISGTTAIKYYFFGGQRVAMKSGSTLTYLHGDHLGSTALATTSGGALHSSEQYFAYGKPNRLGAGTNLPTDNTYTGQKSDGSGLMYYGARYYDPQIGLFVSPDTIVPDAGRVFGYNRTMYTFGNPMKFVDPSGHDPCDSDKGCEDSVISTVVTIEHVIRACGGMINCDKMIAWLKSHPGYNPFSDPYYTGNSGMFVEVWGQMANIAWSSGNHDLAAQYHSIYLQGAAASDPNILVEGLGAGAIYVATNGISAAAKSSGLVDGGCSFNAQTLVTTTEGEKAIVLIREGDKVLAWNQETGTIGYYTVTDTHAHLDRVLVYLTIDGETILTTPEHPFFTESGEWVGAGELRVGNRVKQIDGDLGTVRKVEVVEQLQLMYNLTVADAHTFVVGEGQWLVHNGSPCTGKRANWQQSTLDELDEMYDGLPCPYCGKQPNKTSIDHIEPWKEAKQLAADRAGEIGIYNDTNNLAKVCQPCNSSKKAQHLLLWLLEKNQ